MSVAEPDGFACLVWDCKIITQPILLTPTVVANLYTLLFQITSSPSRFTAVDLKETFFTIPSHPDSHDLFAFAWEDPDTRTVPQFTQTAFPQRF